MAISPSSCCAIIECKSGAGLFVCRLILLVSYQATGIQYFHIAVLVPGDEAQGVTSKPSTLALALPAGSETLRSISIYLSVYNGEVSRRVPEPKFTLVVGLSPPVPRPCTPRSAAGVPLGSLLSKATV